MKQRQNFLKQLRVGPGGLGDELGALFEDEDLLLSSEGLAKLNELGYQDYLNRFQQPGGGGDGQGITSQYPYYIPPVTQADVTGQTVAQDPTLPVDPIRFASGQPSQHDFSSQYFYGADGGRSGFAGGGIADLRQAYGLGKLVKKATKAIGKIAKSPVGLAALSSFIPFGESKANLFSRMGGMTGLKNMIMGKPLGYKTADDAVARSGGLLEFLKSPMGLITGASALGGLYTGMTQDDDEMPEWLKKWYADKAAADAQFSGISDPSNLESIRFADGGRIGYANGGNGGGGDPIAEIVALLSKRMLGGLTTEETNRLDELIKDTGFMEQKAQGGRIGYDVEEKIMKPASDQTKYQNIMMLVELFKSQGMNAQDALNAAQEQAQGFGKAQGGRIGYKKGGDHTDRQLALNTMYGIRTKAQEGGLMDLGGMEKDYREEGGFVPIGGQERADDVPARLSKNEFVFTADAVRAAGGGDIDAGAEVMENLMNNLEQGGQVSEESQGLEGARNMFATAQRLEGVM